MSGSQNVMTDEQLEDEIGPLDPHRADGALGEKVAAALEDAGEEVASRLVRSFQQWVTLREHAVKERKRLSEELASRIALFKEAMEVGHSNANDQILKLGVVEARWQDLEDAREARKEITAAMRDQIKVAEQKIKDQIAEAKNGQLNLFQSPSEGSTGAAE